MILHWTTGATSQDTQAASMSAAWNWTCGPTAAVSFTGVACFASETITRATFTSQEIARPSLASETITRPAFSGQTIDRC